jgi:hypothetical protein
MFADIGGYRPNQIEVVRLLMLTQEKLVNLWARLYFQNLIALVFFKIMFHPGRL